MSNIKAFELALELLANSCRIVQVELALVLAPDVPVQANRKVGHVAAEQRRLGGR